MEETHPSSPRPWNVLASRYLFKQPPWLTVRKDRVQLPSGATIDDYFVLEYPSWVNVIAVTRDDQVILIRQYRHALGRASYELPAGVVDETDDDLEAAGRRELREETGFGAGRWERWFVCSANPSTHNNLLFTYLALDVERMSEPAPEATEDLTVHLLSLEQVRALIDADEVLQAMHVAPLLKYLLSRAERRK